VRRTQANLGHFFDNARVLCLNGKASYRIARALSEHTENFQFADPYLEYGVPGFIIAVSPKLVMNLIDKAVAYAPPFLYSEISGL